MKIQSPPHPPTPPDGPKIEKKCNPRTKNTNVKKKNDNTKESKSEEDGMKKFWTEYMQKNNKNTVVPGKTADSESTNRATDGSSVVWQKAGVPAKNLSNTGIGVPHDKQGSESQVVTRV